MLRLLQQAVGLRPHVVGKLALSARVPVCLRDRRHLRTRLRAGAALARRAPPPAATAAAASACALWGQQVAQPLKRVAVAVLQHPRLLLERVIVLIVLVPAVAQVRPREVPHSAARWSKSARTQGASLPVTGVPLRTYLFKLSLINLSL